MPVDRSAKSDRWPDNKFGPKLWQAVYDQQVSGEGRELRSSLTQPEAIRPM